MCRILQTTLRATGYHDNSCPSCNIPRMRRLCTDQERKKLVPLQRRVPLLVQLVQTANLAWLTWLVRSVNSSGVFKNLKRGTHVYISDVHFQKCLIFISTLNISTFFTSKEGGGTRNPSSPKTPLVTCSQSTGVEYSTSAVRSQPSQPAASFG